MMYSQRNTATTLLLLLARRAILAVRCYSYTFYTYKLCNVAFNQRFILFYGLVQQLKLRIFSPIGLLPSF